MRCAWRPLVTAAVLVGLAGCGIGSPSPGATDRLTVFAAASLTDVFSDLGERYERRHPEVSVNFSFASSATLARQITQGAPADVFAAADRRTMATVAAAGLAPGDPPVFARNRLVIGVPGGNPAAVRALADLRRPELVVALCAPQVPCGSAAAAALHTAGVTVEPDTYEKDVRAVTAKLALGEVDAGLVYRTDVRAARGRVAGIEFPEAERAVNDYPVTVLAGPPDRDQARGFVEFVRSPTARRVLTEAGFELP